MHLTSAQTGPGTSPVLAAEDAMSLGQGPCSEPVCQRQSSHKCGISAGWFCLVHITTNAAATENRDICIFCLKLRAPEARRGANTQSKSVLSSGPLSKDFMAPGHAICSEPECQNRSARRCSSCADWCCSGHISTNAVALGKRNICSFCVEFRADPRTTALIGSTISNILAFAQEPARTLVGA